MRRCQNTRFSLFGMCTSCESQYTILQQKRIPLCLSFRNVHSHTGMMGIDRNDIELYKSVYRDHPLRRRTDISDDGQLWSMSRINRESKKIVQAVDIPLVSDVQRTIPEVHKSEIENREYQYPVHETCNSMKTLATSRRNWILNHVALHLGVITEIGADAIVVGTDRSMTRYQLSSGHVYNQELPSLSNTFKKKKKSVTVEPVGTVRSTEGLINCVAATAILVVQPRRTDEEEYKLCINNVLNEVRENNHRSLLLPILGLSQLDVNRYKAVQWTLEGIKDWMNNGEMKGFISGVETNNQKKNKEVRREGLIPQSINHVRVIIISNFVVVTFSYRSSGRLLERLEIDARYDQNCSMRESITIGPNQTEIVESAVLY